MNSELRTIYVMLLVCHCHACIIPMYFYSDMHYLLLLPLEVSIVPENRSKIFEKFLNYPHSLVHQILETTMYVCLGH